MPRNGNVTRPRIEPMLMIRPSRFCRMEGSTARVTRSSPMTLVSKIAFACSVVKASVTPTEAIPALLTSTSIWPASASTVLTPASTDVSSLTSSSTVLTPSLRRASAASRLLPCAPRIEAYTEWPTWRRVSAVSRPKPLLAPVIRIVLDIAGFLCVFLLLLLRWCRVGGRGGGRWLGPGEVGAADPDHGEVDDQGEQRDPGGDQEPAAEPGGEGVVVDRCGQRPARVHRVPGLRGSGGLGVGAVGDDGPGDGAEQRQADGAAELLAGVEQAGGHPGVGFGDAVQRDQGQRDEQQGGAGADDYGRAEHRAGVGVVLADPGQPVQAAGGGCRAGDQQRAGADPGDELGDGPGSEEQGGGEWEVGQAGLQGRVAPGGLHEHGEEEEHAEDEDAHPGVA